MNCLDCHDADRPAVPAVAASADCGAGTCRDHAVVQARTLIAIGVMGRQEPVDPPARSVRCWTCDAAHVALHNAPARHARSPR